MKKVPAIPMILAGIIVVLAVVLIGALLLMRQQQSPIRGVAPILQIAAMEADSSLWGQNFPNQYSTFMMTRPTTPAPPTAVRTRLRKPNWIRC